MTPVRVVQVGLGGWGRDWAWRVNPQVPEVEVVGYVDSDPAALSLLAKRVPESKSAGFGTLEAAIDKSRPEAALITAPLDAHAPLVRAALDAGLHVLVEKPFVAGVASGAELVATAANRKLVLMVSQNYRFFPAPRVVEEILRAGSLGELYQIAIDFRRYSPFRAGRVARHHADEQPLLVDMSVHHFDLLRMLLGRGPDSISCDAANPSWSPFAGPAVATATVRFGDVLAGYRGSWISAGPITPWAGEWRMELQRGSIFWTSRGDLGALADRVVVRERGRRPHKPPLPQMRVDRWGTLTEFATAIREGREPQCSGRDNLGTMAFVEAAVASATRGAAVRIAQQATPRVT